MPVSRFPVLFVALAVAAAAATAAVPSTAAAASGGADVGWDELFKTHNASVDNVCMKVAGLPAFLNGTFIIPSLGQFEMGGEVFQGLLDGFGKLQRFTLSGGRLCFTARMMDTTFFNQSIAAGKVAPSMLFLDTAPPRGYSGLKNLAGGNDNVYVNTYSMGGKYRCVTDSQVVLEFDPLSLGMTGKKIAFTDKLVGGMSLALGSAHQLPAVAGSAHAGCVVNVLPQSGLFGGAHSVGVYKICPDAPYARVGLNKAATGYMPYFHSWGLTATHVVLPIMHFTIDIMKVMGGGTLSEAFVAEDAANPTTTFTVMPLDGSAATNFTLDRVLFYTHTINTFDNATATVFDCVAWRANPFTTWAALAMYRNKTARDSMGDRGVPTRVVLHRAGPLAGTATSAPLAGFGAGEAMGHTSTDFTKINNAWAARADYCVFYSVQWNYDNALGDDYASMGIIKHDICAGTTLSVAWPNMYPSEPTFVPDPAGTAEDDGVLVFTVLNGATARSSLVTVDARSMTLLSNATLPTVLGFTTHGEFYPGLGAASM